MRFRSILSVAGLSGVLTLTAPAQAQIAAGLASGPPIWIVSAIGAVFVGVVAFVGAMALKTLKAARASRSWPVAAGTVLSGDIREMTERDSDGGVTTYHIPRLRYAYEVAGRSFESGRIRFGDVRESLKGARKILERYAVGSTVQVRYDPANPANATLETKAGSVGLMLFALAVLGGLLVFMSVVFLG